MLQSRIIAFLLVLIYPSRPYKKSPSKGRFIIILFESELDAFGLLGLAGFADDCFHAALTLRHRLRKTHLRFLQWHHATLEDFAVETTDDVLVRLTLIFSGYFNCHIGVIIAQMGEECKSGMMNQKIAPKGYLKTYCIQWSIFRILLLLVYQRSLEMSRIRSFLVITSSWHFLRLLLLKASRILTKAFCSFILHRLRSIITL